MKLELFIENNNFLELNKLQEELFVRWLYGLILIPEMFARLTGPKMRSNPWKWIKILIIKFDYNENLI